MTGFGRASHAFAWGTVTFEIASVNHRYQEISVRLPKEIASFESAIVVSLRSALKRGKIRLSAEIGWAGECKMAKLDTDALCAYYNQLQRVAGQLKAPPVSDLTNLLALPGVCDAPCFHGEDEEERGKFLEALTEAAAEALMEMKRSEGAKLQKIVEWDLEEFEGLVRRLSARWDEASSESLESLKTRIEKVMERFDLEIDPHRIAQEVSLMADKWDVSEELKRLASHISKFREITSGKDSEGRKLDFLIQEMNREVNTMGSKVGDAEFRWMVVDAKSCLERIREQIQNVE
ncbi:MAG: YicC family protein [Synergistaceae bacterium]|nr:YicC family protein [Synergistaceae bacterium]